MTQLQQEARFGRRPAEQRHEWNVENDIPFLRERSVGGSKAVVDGEFMSHSLGVAHYQWGAGLPMVVSRRRTRGAMMQTTKHGLVKSSSTAVP